MSNHILDRPVWSALSTVHRQYAQGNKFVQRFDPSIGPLTGITEEWEIEPDQIESVLIDDQPIYLVQAERFGLAHQFGFSGHDMALQMVLNLSVELEPSSEQFIRLGHEDVSQMVELARLTQPGPFAERTHVLGEFYGKKVDGKLVAMAGERLRQPGYSEVSGVCTHPDFQKRGLARNLCLKMMEVIRNRGEVPYLHVYEDNVGAINLYETLGFETRARMDVFRCEKADFKGQAKSQFG